MIFFDHLDPGSICFDWLDPCSLCFDYFRLRKDISTKFDRRKRLRLNLILYTNSKYAALANCILKVLRITKIHRFAFLVRFCLCSISFRPARLNVSALTSTVLKICIRLHVSTLCSNLCFDFVLVFMFRPTRLYVLTLCST